MCSRVLVSVPPAASSLDTSVTGANLLASLAARSCGSDHGVAAFQGRVAPASMGGKALVEEVKGQPSIVHAAIPEN